MRKYLLLLLLCSLCQAQSPSNHVSFCGALYAQYAGSFKPPVCAKDSKPSNYCEDDKFRCWGGDGGSQPSHDEGSNAWILYATHRMLPTEYRPIAAMLDYVPGPGNPYEGILIGFSSDGVGIGLKIHRPSWNQGLSLDLPDQKNVGVIIDIGPTSEGILVDCHYMNYWKGAQAEEAHFCYSPIPTEYQPVTAMLDYVPGNLYEGVLIVFTDLTQNLGTHSTRPDSKLDFDALNNGFTEGVAGCSVSGYIAYHQIDNNNIEVLTLPENPPCIGIAAFSLQYKIAKTENSFQAQSEWHECTADEMNRYLGVILPLAYCKDANNHIPMCKPDSKPDEVCWELPFGYTLTPSRTWGIN